MCADYAISEGHAASIIIAIKIWSVAFVCLLIF
jgi:hypothetical protein